MISLRKTLLLISLFFPFYGFAQESSPTVSGSAKSTIRLASGEWPPYQSQHLKYNGVASRIVREAFRLENIKVEFGYFPWARSLENAETGSWDGTFLWFDSPERRKVFYISDPIVDIEYVFFHLKSTPFDWKTVEDLQEFYVGATIKYYYGEAFKQAENQKTIRVERAPSDEVNFRKLLERRIQIFPNDLDAGLEIINNLFSPQQAQLFTYHKTPVRYAPHHLLLSKTDPQNADLIKRFNLRLKQLKDSGTIAQYLIESRRGDYKL